MAGASSGAVSALSQPTESSSAAPGQAHSTAYAHVSNSPASDPAHSHVSDMGVDDLKAEVQRQRQKMKEAVAAEDFLGAHTAREAMKYAQQKLDAAQTAGGEGKLDSNPSLPPNTTGIVLPPGTTVDALRSRAVEALRARVSKPNARVEVGLEHMLAKTLEWRSSTQNSLTGSGGLVLHRGVRANALPRLPAEQAHELLQAVARSKSSNSGLEPGALLVAVGDSDSVPRSVLRPEHDGNTATTMLKHVVDRVSQHGIHARVTLVVRPPPRKEGTLLKLPSDVSNAERWRQRYFDLRLGVLRWYSKKGGTKKSKRSFG